MFSDSGKRNFYICDPLFFPFVSRARDPLYDPLYSISAGGKDLSNNTDPETCTKMLQKLSEKLRAKFPATTRGYSRVKIARLDDVFV